MNKFVHDKEEAEMGWIAKLDNRFDGVEYLRIALENGGFLDGGNQEWWREKAISTRDTNYRDFSKDPYYRLWTKGCGVIAMCDMEFYLLQQNAGEATSLAKEVYPACVLGTGDYGRESILEAGQATDIRCADNVYPLYTLDTGVVRELDYRSYVEAKFVKPYRIGGNFFAYNTALTPMKMMAGLQKFLRRNGSPFRSVRWAPYWMQGREGQRQSVLECIREMLERNLPIVFGYYSTRPGEGLSLYASLEEAERQGKQEQSVSSHYMTIIGLYRGSEEIHENDAPGANGDRVARGQDDKDAPYFLQILSWGKIYYIRYEDFAGKLSFFTNILRVS